MWAPDRTPVAFFCPGGPPVAFSGPGTMWNRFPVPENPRGLILSRIGWNGAENETGWGPEIETGWGRGQNATGWGQPWGCPWAGGCLGLAWQGSKPWVVDPSRIMTVETPGPVIDALCSDTASTCYSWFRSMARPCIPPPPPPVSQRQRSQGVQDSWTEVRRPLPLPPPTCVSDSTGSEPEVLVIRLE